MRVLVTGADGFVGVRLVERLRRDGHEVIAAVRPDRPLHAEGSPAPWAAGVTTVPFELLDGPSVRGVVAIGFDVVVHLAAVASGGDARRDPTDAWQVNTVGTARLAEELGHARAAGESDALLLAISTAEVYGAGRATPRIETDSVEPCSPYAASKLGGENAALEVRRRTGLRVVVARAFPHTGRGQDQRFVAPAFARRLVEAKRAGRRQIAVGNLDPVREFLHVADVVDAYVQLMRFGLPGEIYNVAGGEAMSLRVLFERLARIVGHAAEPVPDPDLMREADIPHLVGDSAKLRALTGWTPTHTLDDALTEVVHAEAD
jgi:GDP-4-dehydro-6-deoxy-D-mannose reductase